MIKMVMISQFLFMLPAVLAGTTVHYFKNPSCDAGSLGNFSDSVSATDSTCHIAPYNVTKAIYIDTIDDDCSIITYSDYHCSPEKARHKLAEREICFFSGAGGLLRSWKNVCGIDLVSATASFASIRATAAHTTTSASKSSVTSYSLTTMTSTSIWHSWNGIANATYSSTVTETKSVPVQTILKGEGFATYSDHRKFAAVLSFVGVSLLGL